MFGRSSVSLLVVALLFGAAAARAAPKAKAKAKANTAAAKPAKKPSPGKEAGEDRPHEQAARKEANKTDAPTTVADDAKASTKEEGLKSAGTTAPQGQDAANVKVKEDKEGVKTYKFQTVEVEGRLKSPQVIYFLRRVRAEFDAGTLGHRSFLGELSDSRRSAAFR